jgi:hypothetical protein
MGCVSKDHESKRVKIGNEISKRHRIVTGCRM